MAPRSAHWFTRRQSPAGTCFPGAESNPCGMFGGWQRDCLLASHQAAPQGGVAQRKRRLRASMAWLTVQEAADLLRVPVSWLYERTRTNSVPHVKLGKYLRFDRDELVAWINELRRDSRGPAAIKRPARPAVRAAQRAEQR